MNRHRRILARIDGDGWANFTWWRWGPGSRVTRTDWGRNLRYREPTEEPQERVHPVAFVVWMLQGALMLGGILGLVGIALGRESIAEGMHPAAEICAFLVGHYLGKRK